MPRLPIPGSDDGQWGNLLNTFLSVAHNNDGSINDTRVTNAELTSNKNQPNGYAGLDSLGGLSVVSRAIRVGPTSYSYAASIAGGGVNSGYLIADKANTASDASLLLRDQGAVRAEIGVVADNDIHFKTVAGASGSEVFTDRLIVKADGNSWFMGPLGVGTVPVERFHVAALDAAAHVLMKIENTNGAAGSRSTGVEFKSSSADWVLGTDVGLNGGNNFFLQDANFGYMPRFFVDSSGRVGLGTDNPGHKLDVTGSIAITDNTSGLYVAEGANSTMGKSTLVGGTVVVSSARVTANSRVFLTIQSPGGSVGSVYIAARTPGVSFTITSTSGTDTSDVAWFIVEPNS